MVRLPDGDDPIARTRSLARHPDGFPVDETLLSFWADVARMIPSPAPDWQSFERDPDLLKEAHGRGVRLLAGTDLSVPRPVPGVALIDELMVRHLELSPHEALSIATLHPAQWFDLTETYGTLEAGKKVNLVLLASSPIDSIDALDEIRYVIANGQLVRTPTR